MDGDTLTITPARRPSTPRLVWPIAIICAVSILAGCGSQPGTVIAVRSVTHASGSSPAPDDGALSAVLHRLDTELSSANAVQTTHPDKLTPQSPEFLALLPVLQAERISELGNEGTALIDRRLQVLGALSDKISQLSTLSRAQRSGLAAQVQAATRGLNQLRRKILNDTLADVLRADVRSITEDFPVLGFLDPKVHLTAACDFLLVAVTDLNPQAAVLQAQIDQQPSTSSALPEERALLADLRSQITVIQNIANTTLASLGALTMAGYPGNKPVLVSARAAVEAGRAAVTQARDDASRILSDLG